jgi:hypothetical protein
MASILTVMLVSSYALACDDNPVSSDRDNSVALSLNPSHAIVDAADTTRVDVNSRNQYGAPTREAVTFTACDAKIAVEPDPTVVDVEHPNRTLVIAGTLGSTCVVATAAGLTDTATVSVVPASIDIGLVSMIGSGASAASTLTFLDKAGNEATGMDESDVVYTVADPAIADVDATGTVTGKAPGDTELTAELADMWGAVRISSAEFSVAPATWTGTITPASANWGDTITVTAPAGMTFDFDARVEFDGLTPFPISSSGTEFVVVGPAGMGSSPSEVTILDVGPNQLAFADTIDVPDPDPADANEPNNGGGGGGGSLSDLGETTPATLPFEEYITLGTGDLDDVFQITLAAQTAITFVADWNFTDTDLDVLIYDSAGDLVSEFGCASAAVPETCTITFDPGTYYVDVNNYDPHDIEWATVLLTMN